MKKFLLLIFAFVFIFTSQVLAAISFDDIVNSTERNEKQILNTIKKQTKTEKQDFLTKNFNSVLKHENQLNNMMLILYLMPKDAFNDKDSLKFFMENVELALIENNNKAFSFYKQRVEKPYFNIYYENLIITTYLFYNNPSNSKQFKDYDKFYHKLVTNKFMFSNPNDKKSFLDFMVPIEDNYIPIGYEFDEKDKKLENIMNAYFSKIDVPSYKIENEYHIYKLGFVILNKYNENSADFILKKIKDKTTNLENLCYFLDNITFDSPIDEQMEKDFDSGFYNPKDAPFKLWAEKRKIYSSDLSGSYSSICYVLYDNNIILAVKDRFNLVYLESTLNPETTLKEFQANVIKDIKSIIKKNLTPQQTENKVNGAILKRYEQIKPKVEKEDVEREKYFNDRLNKLQELLK